MAQKKDNTQSAPTLSLPSPTRISKDVDAMLESTLQERFSSVVLVKTSEEVKKGTWVIKHTPSKDDPKVNVSEINSGIGHLARFVLATLNAWSSGMGLSGDGSALYVAKYKDDVFKVIPALKSYDLFIQPAGRSGCAKYRMGFLAMVNQVIDRATAIQTSLDEYGVAAGKERTRRSESAPQITVEF